MIKKPLLALLTLFCLTLPAIVNAQIQISENWTISTAQTLPSPTPTLTPTATVPSTGSGPTTSYPTASPYWLTPTPSTTLTPTDENEPNFFFQIISQYPLLLVFVVAVILFVVAVAVSKAHK
ncbi:MAG: hypothetical protein ACQCN3_02420 [Candidatus Bathyarchaeia archaeon]|jgi:hypothetical protein